MIDLCFGPSFLEKVAFVQGFWPEVDQMGCLVVVPHLIVGKLDAEMWQSAMAMRVHFGTGFVQGMTIARSVRSRKTRVCMI